MPSIRNTIISWDFLAAILAGVFAITLSPSWLPIAFVSQIYGIGITVLAIVFSVFFAALVVIISSNDNEFVLFLEEDGFYSEIIGNYKYSLAMLFIALLYSFILCVVTSFEIAERLTLQSKWAFVGFTALFIYGLFLAAYATDDCIRYAKTRVDYGKAIKKAKEDRMLQEKRPSSSGASTG